MNITAIIQARMTSTRLPGKVLKHIEGKTMLERVIERTLKSKKINRVVIATTTDSEDDVLAQYCERARIDFYRGSVNDVLERYYLTAKKFEAEVIARITSDCPLIDPGVVDQVASIYIENASSLDLVSNAIVPSYPDGLDVSVFSFSSLEEAFSKATLPSEREHVTPWILKSKKTMNLWSSEDYSSMRWTVDEARDLEFVCTIYRELRKVKGDAFNYKDVIQFLENHNDLLKINSGIIRDEGYLKSLAADKEFLAKTDGKGGTNEQ